VLWLTATSAHAELLPSLPTLCAVALRGKVTEACG